MAIKKFDLKILLTFLLVGFMPISLIAMERQDENPYIVRTGNVFADIDTVNQIVYTVLDSGLWKYEIHSKSWKFLDSLSSFSNLFYEYEFGYNHYTEKLNIWSKGVGEVYEIDPKELAIQRIDKSFPHKNQNGHFPFFSNGSVHAYGGYGFWDWHGYITSFNSNTNEWSLFSVSENSSLPVKRIPHSGFYNSTTNEFYIHGGETSSSGEYDGRNLKKIVLTDIWKLSLENAKWTKVSEIELQDFSFFRSFEVDAIRTKKKISTSFFSPNSNIWYLPVMNKKAKTGYISLKPFDISNSKALPIIEIPNEQNLDFLPCNFLFNPKTNSAILVGINYLSNSLEMPVIVLSLPESELIALIDKSTPKPNYFIYLAIGVALFFSFIFYFKQKSDGSEEALAKLNIQDIEKFNWLNSDEKLILEFLNKSETGLESQELEDSVWPHIVNYDYKRKLRNETVNSINKKYSSLFKSNLELIIRKKDISDHRRFIFSLNPDIINSEKKYLRFA